MYLFQSKPLADGGLKPWASFERQRMLHASGHRSSHSWGLGDLRCSSEPGMPESQSPFRNRTRLAPSRLVRFEELRISAVPIADRDGRRMWRTSSVPPLQVMWIGRFVVEEVAAIDFAEMMTDASA